MKQSDYILVKFTISNNVFYIAQIEEVRDQAVDVRYLRSKGNKFLKPMIAKQYYVLKTNMECQLAALAVQGETKCSAKQLLLLLPEGQAKALHCMQRRGA